MAAPSDAYCTLCVNAPSAVLTDASILHTILGRGIHLSQQPKALISATFAAIAFPTCSYKHVVLNLGASPG